MTVDRQPGRVIVSSELLSTPEGMWAAIERERQESRDRVARELAFLVECWVMSVAPSSAAGFGEPDVWVTVEEMFRWL